MNVENKEFIEILRARLRLVLKVKNMSMASVSRASGASEASLKDFMNGRKNNTTITTLLGWARVLDIPYTALIGEFSSNNMVGVDETTAILGETDAQDVGYAYKHGPMEGYTEIGLQRKAGENLRFVRMALGLSVDDFAKPAFIAIEVLTDYELGKEMVPPLVVVRLCKAFNFSVDDIYN